MGLMNVINYIPAIGYVSCGPMVHTNRNIIKSFCSVFGKQTHGKGNQKSNDQYYCKIMKSNNQWSPTLMKEA